MGNSRGARAGSDKPGARFDPPGGDQKPEGSAHLFGRVYRTYHREANSSRRGSNQVSNAQCRRLRKTEAPGPEHLEPFEGAEDRAKDDAEYDNAEDEALLDPSARPLHLGVLQLP